MNRKLLHLVFAAALSGTAALGVASDSDFVADEIRGLHSELADTRRWVDSDIRANLAHRWKTIPNRLAQRGFGWAESELESLSWIPNADLAVESDSAGRLAGFSAGGTGLLWTGESAAVGFQPWGRWTDGGENDAASFGVFSRRALGDWGVVGGNVFADYAASAEFGDFARWSAGLDFQSALGELRGNYYAGLSSTRERVGLENRVLAYAPSGVDAELRLRWFGGSEWSGFAEYEKWSGQFGDSDLEEVGYGLSFRPAGGGLLAGLWVDAGFRDSADSAGRWDLRLGYSRRLGADDSVRDSGSAFAVRSALVAPVAREREIQVVAVTMQEKRINAQARAQIWQQYPDLWIYDSPPYLAGVEGKCDLYNLTSSSHTAQQLEAMILSAADGDAEFDLLCRSIRAGGNVNAQNASGGTPLHLAVNNNAIQNFKLLLAANANVSLANNNGYTALDRAQMKYLERIIPAEIGKAQTIAMILRAEGAVCKRMEGTLCTIGYESLFPATNDFGNWIWDSPVIQSDAKGIVHRIEIPGFEGVSIQWNGSTGDDLYTIYADGRVSLMPDAVLLGASKRNFYGQIQRPGDRYPFLYDLGISIESAEVDWLWTIPRVLKTAPFYTGALFTVTVTPLANWSVVGFEIGDEYAFDGGDFENTGILSSDWFRTQQNPLHFSIAGGGLQGKYYNQEVVLSALRPVTPNQPLVKDLGIWARFRDYAEAKAKMTFTIMAVAQPRLLSVGVEMGQSGAIHTLSADVDGLEFFEVNVSEDLDVTRKGVLQLVKPIEAKDGVRTITVRATSPNLLGELRFTVHAFLDCKSQRSEGARPHDGKYQKSGNNTGLLNAVIAHNIADVCKFLRLGANPDYLLSGYNDPFEYGRVSPLGAIGEYPKTAPDPVALETIARILIQAGADPNGLARSKRYDDGRYYAPLHLVADQNHLYVGFVRVLLQNGANPHLVDPNGETPLIIASRLAGKDSDVFDLILDATSDTFVNYQQNQYSGNTPCETYTNSCFKRTAIYHAGKTDSEYRFARLLSRGANPNLRNSSNQNAYSGHVTPAEARAMQNLLDHGTGLNTVNANGLAPLHRAASEGKSTLVNALLAIPGVNPKIGTTLYYRPFRKPIGSTPLDFVQGNGLQAQRIRAALNAAIAKCGIDPNLSCSS